MVVTDDPDCVRRTGGLEELDPAVVLYIVEVPAGAHGLEINLHKVRVWEHLESALAAQRRTLESMNKSMGELLRDHPDLL